MTWITLRTTSFRWEAELMQQLLAAHQIPTRVLDLGILYLPGSRQSCCFASTLGRPDDGSTFTQFS